MKCPSCRAENLERANFCKSCGTKLKEVREIKKIKSWLYDFPERHPYLPLGMSIVALIASIGMPILRKFLA